MIFIIMNIIIKKITRRRVLAEFCLISKERTDIMINNCENYLNELSSSDFKDVYEETTE